MAWQIDAPAEPRATLLLAHGAGAPMDSAFMAALAQALASQWRVVRFEFPYMAQRREDGRKRPPPALARLEASFAEQISAARDTWPGPLLIGGKSMGGRVASRVAATAAVDGLVDGWLGFGFPFHAPGKPVGTRIDHLRTSRVPGLIVQGTRDPFGKPDEVAGYGLGEAVTVHWLDSGDHDFKPLVRSGHTQAQRIATAAAVAHQWWAEQQ